MNNNRKSPAPVIEYLLARPDGAPVAEIAQVLGVTVSRASELMSRWRREGLVAVVGAGPTRKWSHVQHAAKLHRKLQQETKEKRLAYFKAYKEKLLLQKDPLVYAAIPIKQKVIPAQQAKPLPKLGPNSVFELAR